MSKILVTGAAGFIGSHIVDKLVERGHDTFGVDDFSTGRKENLNPRARNVQLNVSNPAFRYFVEEVRPDVILHLAAQPSLGESVSNPKKDAEVNIVGTINVLRAATENGANRIVFASTSAVYDEPRTPYGFSKSAAEWYLLNLPKWQNQNIMPVILRLGNVFGPRQMPLGDNQLIPRVLRHFFAGDSFYIHDDGNQTRAFIYVEDVVDAFLMAAFKDTPFVHHPPVYNVAGPSASVNWMLQRIVELVGVPRYVFQHKEINDDRRFVTMRIEETVEEFGWSPRVSHEDGLRKTVAWWQNEYPGIHKS